MESKMNDKVWDLIEQADEQGGDDPDIRDALLVKLVVQACLSVVEKNHEKAMNEYDTDVDYAMCSTRVDIENQFGVKE